MGSHHRCAVTMEGEEEDDAQRQLPLNQDAYLDRKPFPKHLIDSVVEEITLEGLDGITFQALKIRLDQRTDLEIEDFEDIAPAIWNQLKYWKGLTFYLLPEPRADLIRHEWNGFRDARGGLYEPLHSPEEIYHYYPVEDKQGGVIRGRGSCEHYQTRKDISQLARKSSYVQIMQGLGNRLVIVASQLMRERILLGPNYVKHQNLTVVQYCIMERIGRSRSSGEPTRGRISLGCLNISPKTQFYMRKHLLKTGLIWRQTLSIKCANGKCPTLITVFHLPRFYKRIESTASLSIRTIFTWLNDSDSKSVPVEKVIRKFGKHTLRNLVGQLPQLVETKWEQRALNEEDPSGLGEGKEQSAVKTKNVRVLRLLEMDTLIQNQAIFEVFNIQNREEDGITAGGEERGGDHGNQEEEQQLSISSASSYSDVQVLRPETQMLTSSTCLFLFRSLMRAGNGGLTLLDISNLMNLTHLEGRACGRFLTRHNACKEGMVKLFKQKAFVYTLVNFSSPESDIFSSLQDKFMQAAMEIERIQAVVLERQRRRIMRIKSKIFGTEKSRCDITGMADPQESSQQLSSLKVEIPEMEVMLDWTPQDISDSQDGYGPQESVSKVQDELRTMRPIEVERNENKNDAMTQAEAGDSSFARFSLSSNPQLVAVINSSESIHSNVEFEETSNKISQLSEKSDENTSKETLISINGDSSAAENMRQEQSTGVDVAEPTDVHHGYNCDNTNNEKLEEFSDNNVRRSIRDKEDAVDEFIRSRMTRQRVAWTPAEDRLVLLTFIGSSLFSPKYPYDKLFTFNSSQIRDLIQKKTNGKSNKTTTTIRRRIQFLLHQKTHFDWYIQHANQAIKDNILYENYVKEHLPPPQPKIYLVPPLEALEPVVDYLLCNDGLAVVETMSISASDGVSTASPPRTGLSGIDTLQFLRQLKRAEFYWIGLMFIIFCRMGETLEARRNFYSDWRELVKANNNENSESSDLPVFEMEEVKEMQMELREMKSGDDNPHSPQDMFLLYCWKFLKFLVKHLNIVFNNILMLGSLPANGFQIVVFDNSMEMRSIRNIFLSRRECTNRTEVQLWTSRSLILEQIFCGENQISKEFLTTGNAEKLPIERAIRSINRAKILVTPKGTDLLRLSTANLRSFLGGLPYYSFIELWDFLKYLDEESSSVDVLACLSVGVLVGIVELTDYWTAKITMKKSVFTVKNQYNNLPSEDSADEEGDIIVSSPPRATKVSELELGPPQKRKKPNPPPPSKGKKRKRKQLQKRRMEEVSTKKAGRPAKKRKKGKDDKIVNEMTDCFSDLSVNGDHKPTKKAIPTKMKTPSLSERNVGLEEGENYLSRSSDHMHLLRIRLHPSTSLYKYGNSLNPDHQQQRYLPVIDEEAVNINFPNLELEFSEKMFQLNHTLGNSQPFSFDALKELRQCLIELVYHKVSSPLADNTPGSVAANTNTTLPQMAKHLNRYSIIFDMISIAGEVGVSGAFLNSVFERNTLVKGVRYLLEAKLVFSLGVVHRRFVTFNNVKDWIIPIRPRISKREVVGHVIVRPWVTTLGGISWTTINRLLTALVGQLHKPSMKLNELCQIFAPTLSPVESLVLIESLAKLKYLTLYKIHEPKITLFSKDSIYKYTIDYNADTLIDTENVYVAVSPYINTLHGQLHHAIQKTSKKKLFTDNNENNKNSN